MKVERSTRESLELGGLRLRSAQLWLHCCDHSASPAPGNIELELNSQLPGHCCWTRIETHTENLSGDVIGSPHSLLSRPVLSCLSIRISGRRQEFSFYTTYCRCVVTFISSINISLHVLLSPSNISYCHVGQIVRKDERDHSCQLKLCTVLRTHRVLLVLALLDLGWVGHLLLLLHARDEALHLPHHPAGHALHQEVNQFSIEQAELLFRNELLPEKSDGGCPSKGCSCLFTSVQCWSSLAKGFNENVRRRERWRRQPPPLARARMLAAGKNSANKRLKCFECLPPVRKFCPTVQFSSVPHLQPCYQPTNLPNQLINQPTRLF